MAKDKGELMRQLKEEFPEIFEGDVISLHLLSNALELCEEYDGVVVVRRVLIEKKGNISGRKARLLKIFNQLSG